jgi:DNA-binding transcriptional regulator YiaG
LKQIKEIEILRENIKIQAQQHAGQIMIEMYLFITNSNWEIKERTPYGSEYPQYSLPYMQLN